MPGDLSQVFSKMEWTGHQLTLLHDAITEYVNREPYVPRIEEDVEAQGYRVFVMLREPPPTTIALIAGDVLNNMHGILDYLAWQLVLRERKRPGARTYFPIQMPNKDGTTPRVNILDSRRQEAIEDTRVLDILRNVQPYYNAAKYQTDARAHLLAVLQRLNRESKHRHIALLAHTIPAPTSYAYTPPDSFMPGKKVVIASTTFVARLKDGDELAFVPYDLVPEDGLPEEASLPPEITFDDPFLVDQNDGRTPVPIASALLVILGYIEREILSPLAPLF